MHRPGSPPYPGPRRLQGFTLIEVLVAVTVAISTIALVATLIPRAAGQAAGRAIEARATVHVADLVQRIEQEFERVNGTFVAFLSGDSHNAQAVFTIGGGYPLPIQNNVHAQTTLLIPGLPVNVGDEVLLEAGNGVSKLVTVTGRPDSDHVTVDCPTGLPSTSTIKAFPARSVKLATANGQLTSTVKGRTSVLAPSDGLSFAYAYARPDGALTRDLPGAPANHVPGGDLIGFIPMAVDAATRIDRADMVPAVGVSKVHLIDCQEMGLIIPDEARVDVTVQGLPAGVDADVTVHGPDSSVDGQRPTASTHYMPVKPGQYSLTANDVTVNGVRYVASVSGSPATLLNAWGTIFLEVTYSLPTGGVNLTMNGLPPGGRTGLNFAGPSVVSRANSANGAYAVNGLLPGEYTVTGTPYTDASGTYTAPSAIVTVTAGQTSSAVLNFDRVAQKGDIKINVAGLPNLPEASALTNLSGPRPTPFTVKLGAITFFNYPVGSYSVQMPPVVFNGVTWYPSASGANLTVVNGQLTTLNFTYSTTPSATASESHEPPGHLCGPDCSVAWAEMQEQLGYDIRMSPGPHPPTNDGGDPEYNLNGTPSDPPDKPGDPAAGDPGGTSGGSDGAGDPGGSGGAGDPGGSGRAGDPGGSGGAGDPGGSAGAGDPGGSAGAGDPGGSAGAGDPGGSGGAGDPGSSGGAGDPGGQPSCNANGCE